jgi:enolase-phosphatase E1
MSESISVVLLDIEGTTTPITFVKDVLFPYARSHLKQYLEDGWGAEELMMDIDAIR